jgi:PHD/YefM family antitoxin component YafN of YafNO toxin-antitoxin module
MNRVQQIAPVTQIQKQPNEVFAKLAAGPVVLAKGSVATAVLVSIDEWDRLADELAKLRLAAESRYIAAANDAGGGWVSSTQMRERMAEHGVMVG